MFRSFAAFVAAQREPAKNVDGKWQKQQDQRAIQSKEINNGSYLVTWVTSCSPGQPLPNLWTSLVRAEPKQSPGAPAASADHHLRTFSPHARCQATGLACRRQAVPSGSIIARREARYFIDTNLKCAI